MQTKCYQCFRPLKTCYCQWITPFDPGIKVVFLMHPQEAYKQKTGTGRLAKLSLKHSELIVGVDFTHHKVVNSLMTDPDYLPVMLYPGPDSLKVDDSQLKVGLGIKKLLVFIIDGTWNQARKMVHLSTNLHNLPRLSFQQDYQSKFSIKHQPFSYCLSTIESVYYLIQELQNAGLSDKSIDPEGLMTIFQRMVAYQHSCRLSDSSAEFQ